jgi:2-polyprenyl-6-methoxyphenol hydroxylase-like FAD-dependent oxidoreductase
MTTYDAIVVGARCAGSPTAMLLARQGHRVLMVDRATFPSDTISTHMIHAPGVAALRRWGLLDEVIASNAPPIDTYSMDFGPFAIAGTPPPVDGVSTGYAPRRTVLDKILVDAADRAGVEIRERFSMDELIVENDIVVGIRGHGADGRRVEERATVVIGADGRNSRVAEAVGARRYNEVPRLEWGVYTYWSGLPAQSFGSYVRGDRAWGWFPTNDDLTLIVVGWPEAERDAYRADVEGNYLATLERAPEFADLVRSATRADRFYSGGVSNFFRQPYGPGWVLVGDAGYTKDPVTAQGISDAFRDAEMVAAGLHDVFAGGSTFDTVMASYQRARDENVLPIYGFTTQLASLEPPPPELQQLLFAVSRDQRAADDFSGVIAGTVSPAAFFDPANVGRLLQPAAAVAR